MGLVLATWYFDLLLLAIVAAFSLFIFYKKRFNHWKKYGIPEPWTPSIPFGHFKGVASEKSQGMIMNDIYSAAKGEKVVGAYFFINPVLIVRDLELVKEMLVKDFGSFHDRGFEFNLSKDPLTEHLFLMNGQEWRNLRIKLTPTFTSGKMKMMFPTLIDIGKQFSEVLNTSSDLAEVEIKDILARYTTDVIASCAFGIEVNSLQNPETLFRKYGKKILNPTFMEMMTAVMFFIVPNLGKYFPIRLMPKDITDFFIGTVRETMRYREENNVHRNDFMQLLLQIKNLGYVKDADNPNPQPDNVQKFTIEQASAQAFVFYFAGFETASNTMQFALYELALNPELQTNVREEIDEALSRNGGKLSYELIHGLSLLDRVVSETLRKYPVAGPLMRQNSKDYKIPNTDMIIPAKTNIWFPVYGYQHDELFYPDPEKFDPDRFLPDAKDSRNHFAYLPFGEGPRICIGSRFGLMQCKVGIALILSQFTVSPSKNTPIPIVFDFKTDFLSPKGLMYLKLSRRSDVVLQH